ncbi:MAG: glutaredoxin 3 [Rickettsiales bacterium]|nr:glutaredoxin 3 [Pseudomonadota bacterium]MDA0966999.1 glutaredoxin 3 [Pseudomonadota bacterium]MDG4543919.1 glutaredoxin 3 [Rickettsiales bacterium]MDG4546065.1 glutaredoxin 3 [Rickettsiales bacterium]MDG4548311.1 glutaredoxin 3 [Rickettsiales bacterium]
MQKVTIYSTQVCPHCVRAKMLLKKKGADFKEIDVSKTEDRDAMIEKTGGARTVPQIYIGDTHVGGADDLYELESKGKLDELLAG